MSKKQNPLSRLYHKLCETRWFYTFTASCTATIVGISLTFGINGCRESRRVRQEARESIMQAVQNLHDRADDIDNTLGLIATQDSIYVTVWYLNRHDIEIPDSLAEVCVGKMLSFLETVNDTSFEKIFRESYQLWQELDHDDLTKKISLGYRIANHIEEYCRSTSRDLSQRLDDPNFIKSLLDDDYNAAADILIRDNSLVFFMKRRYDHTQSNLNAAKYLHQTIAEIDSICSALGYGTTKVSKTFYATPSAIDSGSTAIEPDVSPHP